VFYQRKSIVFKCLLVFKNNAKTRWRPNGVEIEWCQSLPSSEILSSRRKDYLIYQRNNEGKRKERFWYLSFWSILWIHQILPRPKDVSTWSPKFSNDWNMLYRLRFYWFYRISCRQLSLGGCTRQVTFIRVTQNRSAIPAVTKASRSKMEIVISIKERQ
jgi:hypothetical protein